MIRVISTTDELTALPEGSVISSAFPDIESNVAEKTSDGFWLVTGESALFPGDDIADWADSGIRVLQYGYGSDDQEQAERLYETRLRNLTGKETQ